MAKRSGSALAVVLVEIDNMATATVTVHVTDPGPQLGGDEVTTEINTPVVINVLANDTDPLGRPLVVTSVTQPPAGQGSVTIDGDQQSLTFTPATGFTGTAEFAYSANNSALVSVRVHVTDSGSIPQLVSDEVTTPLRTSIVINVLANDADPLGRPLEITSVTQPRAGEGSVAISADRKTITFTPDLQFVGTSQFTYDAAPVEEPPPPPEGELWTPFNDPEMIVKAFMQEDVEAGLVTTWQSRGVRPVAATGTANKLLDNGGVLFAKGTDQRLSWGNDGRTPMLHRWWLVIAKCDMANKVNNNVCPVLAVHTLAGNSQSKQPGIWFSPPGLTLIQGLNDGTNKTFSEVASPDLSKWSVLFGSIRGWSCLATINGSEKASLPFKTFRVDGFNSSSWIGAGLNAPGTLILGADLVVDCVIIGQGEPSDALIDKLVGWAHWRADCVDLLPADHPYKAAPPVADGSEGVPARHIHDSAAWAAYKASPIDRINFANVPPLPDATYSRVFFDDFRTDSVEDLWTGQPSAAFFDRTWLTIINRDAQTPGKTTAPVCYVHTAADPGYMSLRLQWNGTKWVSGAFSTVNQNGSGRWWGLGRFITRVRFSGIPPFGAPPGYPWPGFFPAWWSYDAQHLFWQTRNRIEPDYWEMAGDSIEDDNVDQDLHVHEGAVPYSSPEILSVGDRAGQMLGHQDLKISHGWPTNVHTYQGWHTYEMRIEEDLTYLIFDGLEIARRLTPRELKVKKYFIWNFALILASGTSPAGLGPWDMDVDYFEVWQKESDLAEVPPGFSARPTLSGTRGPTNTITCTPNATGQLEYRWYKNGEPIVGIEGPTFIENIDSSTKALRVHVRALSHLSQPEAWTAEVAA